MNKIANKDSRYYVDKKIEFQGSNLSGEIKSDNNGQIYVVKSYGYYPLFIYSFRTSKWYETIDSYSVSTARQMTHSRPTEKTKVLPHKCLEDIMKKTINEIKYWDGKKEQEERVYNKVNNRFKELAKDDEPINIIDDKGTYSIPKVDRMFNTSKESSLVGIKKMSKARVKFKPIKKRS